MSWLQVTTGIVFGTAITFGLHRRDTPLAAFGVFGLVSQVSFSTPYEIVEFLHSHVTLIGDDADRAHGWMAMGSDEDQLNYLSWILDIHLGAVAGTIAFGVTKFTLALGASESKARGA